MQDANTSLAAASLMLICVILGVASSATAVTPVTGKVNVSTVAAVTALTPLLSVPVKVMPLTVRLPASPIVNPCPATVIVTTFAEYDTAVIAK
jgi:hypothetical protein